MTKTCKQRHHHHHQTAADFENFVFFFENFDEKKTAAKISFHFI